MEAVKAARVMLSAVNEKLNETAKILAAVKQQKEKLHQKLQKLKAKAAECRKDESKSKPAKR